MAFAQPRSQISADPLAQQVLRHRLVNRGAGLLLLFAAILDEIPIRQAAVSARAQFIRGFHRLEELDRIGYLPLLGKQIAEREPPAVVGIGPRGPLPQYRFEFLRLIERDQQAVLLAAPRPSSG